jgi:hypothetical protein
MFKGMIYCAVKSFGFLINIFSIPKPSQIGKCGFSEKATIYEKM